MPAGKAHAWLPGAGSTPCGLFLNQSRLGRFLHVDWLDVQTESGHGLDRMVDIYARCAAAIRGRRTDTRT